VENAGARTTIRANRMHDDLGLTGVAVWNQETASAAVVTRNSIRGAGNAGVDDAGSGSVVRRNAIDGRLGELTLGFWARIEVRPQSIGAARNLAIGNGDLGILALAGVTDAGGNRAAGNGNPAQCAGVACRSGWRSGRQS
jgi:hypothetical protein